MPPRWGWSCIHTTTTHGSRHGLVSTAPFGAEIVTMDLTAFIGLAHPAGTAQDKPPKLSCTPHLRTADPSLVPVSPDGYPAFTLCRESAGASERLRVGMQSGMEPR